MEWEWEKIKINSKNKAVTKKIGMGSKLRNKVLYFCLSLGGGIYNYSIQNGLVISIQLGFSIE